MTLVAWGLGRGNVRFAYLGDYANSRGAADMGLLPDLLPGYVPVSAPGCIRGGISRNAATAGHDASRRCSRPPMAALSALLVVGANPAERRHVNPAALKNTFVVVQDLFLTETAATADVVFPAASLYEKTGTVTNTFGDLQLARKAADQAGVKPDFEILVRLAEQHGRGCEEARALRQGRRDGRSGAVARRAIGRGRPARCLALGEWPGTEAEPVRSACAAR